MFDVAMEFMGQLISIFPVLFTLYVLFDFIGSLLFGKR